MTTDTWGTGAIVPGATLGIVVGPIAYSHVPMVEESMHGAKAPADEARAQRDGPDYSHWRTLEPPPRLFTGFGLGELWRHRELAVALAARDLRLRYRQTLFGIAWAVLQPLAAMGIFALVFGKFAKVPSDGIKYPLFVLTGLALWSPISSAVLAAAASLVEDRDLVTKVWFPRMLAPIGAVLATGVDLVIALALLVPVMAAYGVAPPLQALTLPLWCAAGLAVAVGAGLLLSAANALYRDVRYVLAFVMQLWLFASPVVFPISIVSPGLRYVMALNPVAGVVEGVRWALLAGPAPGAWIAVSAGTLVVLLASGALYFRLAERSFADRI
jgi:lipopolysaccharide transport system permease protein